MTKVQAPPGVSVSNRLLGPRGRGRRRCRIAGRMLRSHRLAVVVFLCCVGMGWCAWSLLGPSSRLSSPARSLADLLPKDLDLLRSERVMGAVAVQLLALGGWTQEESSPSRSSWKRRRRRRPSHAPFTLKDRLSFITPTWKQGGMLDYGPATGIFEDGATLLEQHHDQGPITTVAQVASLLEDGVGMTVADFGPTQEAVRAMLSWQIPAASQLKSERDEDDDDTLLLVFSFGKKESCRDSSDCPYGPGATNELLAATAAHFVETHTGNVHVLAQWEVATALWQRYNGTISNNSTLTSVGVPGSYETTADVLERMICTWGQNHWQISQLLLLAHPDHVRRVLWTAQSLLQGHNGQKKNNLRTRTKTKLCALQPARDVRLLAAIQPYDLDWPAKPIQQPDGSSNINLFGLPEEPVEVHGDGTVTTTNWYDHAHLGFFSDSRDQEWTHERDVWILYDQWAVLKGIATGTIDLKSISPLLP